MKIPKRVKPKALDKDSIVASAARSAKALVACGDGFIPQQVENVPAEGSKFAIDLLIPEGVETGDSREFELNSLSSRDFPLPLYWQIMTDEGHKGSVIVGRIDYAERLEDVPDEAIAIDFADSTEEIIEDIPENEELFKSTPKGWGNAYGVFDSGPYGREAERLVRGGFLRGVSADLDKFEAAMELASEDEDESNDKIKNEKMVVKQARLMGATLLGKPAFQECSIRIVEDEPLFEELPVEDGMYEEAIDDPEATYSAMIASAAPVVPPRTWFSNPGLKAPTPITVTDEGQVFGHIAAWNVDHIGLPRATKPPRSRSNYAYFRTGVLRTDDGSDVPVGQLTLAGGHASMSATAAQAIKHYDDTASAIADVSAGEDAFGIWVSGAVRPDATPTQIRALRASAPSGDWRPINGRLELVAVCQVNVPGFPVARAMVAGGQMTALVAAGARPIAELRSEYSTELSDRLDALERREFESQKAAAFAAISPIKQKRDHELNITVQDSRRVLEQMRAERDAELSARVEAARLSILGDNS